MLVFSVKIQIAEIEISGEFSSKFVNFRQLFGKNQRNFDTKTVKMRKKVDEIWLKF